MKQELNLWLSQQTRLPGVLACGLRYTDRTSFSQQWARTVPADALEKSLACLNDLWRVLRLHGFQAQWVRWGYAKGWFYAAQRADGVLLGIITQRADEAELAAVKELLLTFLNAAA